MKGKALVGLLAASVAMAGTAVAQDDDGTAYVYATYYYCDTDKQGIADALVENSLAPAYDAAVDDGTINSWGWMVHHTGGKWRRLMYWAVDSQEALIDAPDAIDEKMEEMGGPGADGLGALCPLHDDYVWRSVTGSTPGDAPEERGEAGFSIYFVCNGDESRADEIVKDVFAPVYNRHVEEGNLVSWGWMEHFIGGKYRRIATMTATDFKALLKARSAIISELDSEHGDDFDEFDGICGSHSDYMWYIAHERP